jgi:tetratricopeptide (TPR) repeat protein
VPIGRRCIHLTRIRIHFEEALLRQSPYPECSYALTQAYISLKQWEKARDRAEQASIGLRGYDPKGEYTRYFANFHANCQEELKEYVQARQDYALVLRSWPNDPGAHYRMAKLLLTCPDPAVQNYPEALAEAEKSVQLTQRKNP